MNDSVYEQYSLYKRFANFLKQYGISYTIRGVSSYLWRQLLYVSYPMYYKMLLGQKGQFIFKERKYDYCLEKYNLSWRTERTLEIPIIQQFIKDNLELNILEIGCVLKHYESSPANNWTIIDKYEKFENVINEDIVKYKPGEKFDLIVSVSTVEHIGIDDGPVDPEKAKNAIDYIMNNLLNKNGKFAFTIPIGYNKYLDQQILNDKIFISEKHYFTRVPNNEWIEVVKGKVLNFIYGKPYIGANALFIGIIKKE